MFVEPGDPALPADELGSIERPRIWYDVNTERGTTSAKYEWFLKPNFSTDSSVTNHHECSCTTILSLIKQTSCMNYFTGLGTQSSAALLNVLTKL